jgi:predicted ATPase
MLTHLRVTGFKSLGHLELSFPKLAVLFGPNAAGKSNLLEAVQALSRLGTSRTLSDALTQPIRGYPLEAFAFPAGGLPALLRQQGARFALEATLEVGKELFRYRVAVEARPASGSLAVYDEYLAALGKDGEPRGDPLIEQAEGQLRLRRRGKAAPPRSEPVGLNHTLLSDPRLGGAEYRGVERCRAELEGWRIYYLDPRVAMRSARPPTDARDIGVLGEDVAPFLYHLRAEKPLHFAAVKRTLRSLIPGVEDLSVDLDEKRGTLDIQVRQGGAEFSSRVLSEGTLRVLALCAVAANPWASGLLAFEEPETGVHPRRLELIAKLLTSLAIDQGRQVIVTTHSALLGDAVLKEARTYPGEVVAIDANCDSFAAARGKVEDALLEEFRHRAIHACPDPHVERWYLADLEAFHLVVGITPRVPGRKCKRDLYKGILKKAVAEAGHPPTLGGIEFARELAEALDYFRAGKAEPGLKHFLEEAINRFKAP